MKTYTQEQTGKMSWVEIRDAIRNGDKVIGFMEMEITRENAELQAEREINGQLSTQQPLSYCTQNDGDCETCALVNYGKDCQNNKINA